MPRKIGFNVVYATSKQKLINYVNEIYNLIINIKKYYLSVFNHSFIHPNSKGIREGMRFTRLRVFRRIDFLLDCAIKISFICILFKCHERNMIIYFERNFCCFFFFFFFYVTSLKKYLNHSISNQLVLPVIY